MDDHTHKLNPLQGLMLLFFLLALPVGIYFYQTQNVGETRSQATSAPTPTSTTTPAPTVNPLALLSQVSPTATPTPEVLEPEIFIDPFYNSKRQSSSKLALSGTTDPFANIDITITPDNVKGVVIADQLGKWQWTPATALKNGEKQMTLRVATDKGGETVKTEVFTVAGAAQFPTAMVVFLLLIAAGVFGYVYLQMKKKNEMLPPAYPETPVSGASSPVASEPSVEQQSPSVEPPAEMEVSEHTPEQPLPTEWPQTTETREPSSPSPSDQPSSTQESAA